MLNVVHKTKGDILTILIDLSKNQGKSASGKSIVIATTQGNQKISADGKTLGLNLYQKNTDS